ncbi:MAG: hypothetical protein R3B48_25675 [Kofleriaceae bacterium]
MIALAAALLGGCIDALAPEVGPPLRAVCVNEDSDPTKDVSFATDLRDKIFAPRCGFCHTPTASTPIGVTLGGLDLSTYATLRSGGVNSAQTIVVPGRPCQSVLVQKVMEGPPFGDRMPENGPPYLSRAEVTLLSDWIAEGARE